MKIDYDYDNWGIRLKGTVVTRRAMPEGTTMHVLEHLEALHLLLRELAQPKADDTPAEPG